MKYKNFRNLNWNLNNTRIWQENRLNLLLRKFNYYLAYYIEQLVFILISDSFRNYSVSRINE